MTKTFETIVAAVRASDLGERPNVKDTTAPLRFMRLPEVCHKVALSRTVVYALIKERRFPEPIKMGYASRWLESEVQDWITARIEDSRSMKGT
jgi:prophage regulatory protein